MNLVERLRSAKFPFRAEPLIVDSADRIEQLEREKQELVEALEKIADTTVIYAGGQRPKIAAEALDKARTK